MSSAICKAHFNKELVRASAHFDGKGLQDGIEYNGTMSLLRNCKDLYSFKCTLETIMAAGSWPMDRVHQHMTTTDPICKRCGNAMDTTLHCYWQCPANGLLEDPAVTSTQVLCPAAEAGSTDVPCLWLRGILPLRFTTLKQENLPPRDVYTTHINNTPSPPLWDTGTYYGDASGGDFSSVPLLRRVGVGVCRISPLGKLLYGIHCNLPGDVQTVPRGEIYALVVLLTRASPLAVIDYVTDNVGLRDAYNAGPTFCHSTNNCFLYNEIRNLISQKELVVTV